jgi:hypothetical protein
MVADVIPYKNLLMGFFKHDNEIWNSINALLVGRSRDRFPVVSLGIFSEATDAAMCPGVDSASKNEYQENSWE